MKIATFNVNSVRARLPNLLDWLKEAEPDVVFLQEIKTEEGFFPRREIEEAGYLAHVVGQKSYNGVATLYRPDLALTVESAALAGVDDLSARYLEVRGAGLVFLNIYAPNGSPAGSDKYSAKLRWFEALIERTRSLLRAEVPFLIGGDFNIIPLGEDCYDPDGWEGDALFNPEVRGVWRTLLNLGLMDAYRALSPRERGAYTFWDYQGGSWPQDKGLRIDHFLLSPQVADRLASATIHKEVRGREKASDHTPFVVSLEHPPQK